MLAQILNQIHNYFISRMLGLCNSYQNMVITMWICFGVLIYLATLFLFKVTKFCSEESTSGALYDMYKAINENDVIGCISYLQKYPQCVNQFTRDGYTPFQMACANGNTQLVKMMLKRGADVTLKSAHEESPFYLAAFYYIKHPRFKNATCLRELYYAGADVDAPNAKGLTPLQMAAAFGHAPLVKWLLAKAACADVAPSPYLLAHAQGHQETADVIWQIGKRFSVEHK